MSASRARRILVALRAVLYALAFLGLWAWLALSVRRFDPELPFVVVGWLLPMGWLLLAASAALLAACVATFVVRGRGTPAPFDPPRAFVVDGPYRFVRNPMYLGGFAMLHGLGLVLRSSAVVLLALAFLLVAHLFVVLYEEPSLSRRFGRPYEHYRSTVRRWIPRRRSPNA